MINGMEQIRYTDKEQRDRAFEDFRQNGDEFEKKAVKFSEVESILKDGKPVKGAWRDVWCIAYPRS
jgi:hypothetical protein